MASVYDTVFTDDEMSALVGELKGHAEYSVNRGKQTSYLIFARAATALQQALKERDELRARAAVPA